MTVLMRWDEICRFKFLRGYTIWEEKKPCRICLPVSFTKPLHSGPSAMILHPNILKSAGNTSMYYISKKPVVKSNNGRLLHTTTTTLIRELFIQYCIISRQDLSAPTPQLGPWSGRTITKRELSEPFGGWIRERGLKRAADLLVPMIGFRIQLGQILAPHVSAWLKKKGGPKNKISPPHKNMRL